MEVNLSSLYQHEDIKKTRVFHIKIYVKKTMIDALFDSRLKKIFITIDLVKNLGLEAHDQPNPYLLR